MELRAEDQPLDLRGMWTADPGRRAEVPLSLLPPALQLRLPGDRLPVAGLAGAAGGMGPDTGDGALAACFFHLLKAFSFSPLVGFKRKLSLKLNLSLLDHVCLFFSRGLHQKVSARGVPVRLRGAHARAALPR